MKNLKTKRNVFIFLGLMLTSLWGQGQGDPFEINKSLGRGMNLGNALEAPNEGEWGVTLEESFFLLIAGVGFKSVRIPVRFSAHALSEAPYTINETFFKRVDWAIDNALKNGLFAIVDMHHYLEMMSDPPGNKDRFLEMWVQIADRYRNYSDSLLFEIFNEPNDQFTAELWNQYLAEAIETIRVTNPGRTFVVGTAEWGGLSALNKLAIPEGENNVIVTFHYYNPFEFTHQGAEWVSGSDAWLGTTWTATQQERLDVSHDFDDVMVWGVTHNRPIFLGEFGAYNKADMTSRQTWTDYVARQAEARNFSWAYWEFCSGFGVYNNDNKGWREALLNALIPETVGIEEKGDLIPSSVKLFQNYPNPFNPSTQIKYRLIKPSHVSLEVYSLEGKQVKVLVNSTYQVPGLYSVDFDASNLASGLYICWLNTAEQTLLSKMVLLR